MFLSTCEIMSTIIGALAGSIASSRVKMDLFGVIVCGTLAALGGGTVRDILLANQKEVLQQSRLFRHALEALEQMVASGNTSALEHAITEASTLRANWHMTTHPKPPAR